MHGDAIAAIGLVTGTLAKILYGMGFTGRWASLASVVISVVAVAIWGYSANDFARETTWNYFSGWVATLGVAAGSFHGIEEAEKKMKGDQ